MELNELIEQKKKEFSPTIKRLETIKVIEYILSKCIESQKEIISDFSTSSFYVIFYLFFIIKNI